MDYGCRKWTHSWDSAVYGKGHPAGLCCVENKVTLALLDVRLLEGLLKTTEAYDLPDKYFPKMSAFSVITRFVIVDRKESRENDRFFENVAVNRGFNLRIFSDSDKAVEWLLS